jgi:hypothetical protein
MSRYCLRCSHRAEVPKCHETGTVNTEPLVALRHSTLHYEATVDSD